MKRFIYPIVALAVLAGCSKSFDETGDSPEAGAAGAVSTKVLNSSAEATPGSLLIRFVKSDIPQVQRAMAAGAAEGRAVSGFASMDSLFVELGVSTLERAFPYNPRFEERLKAFGLDEWYVVRFGDSVPVEKVASSLASVSQVSEIQFNTRLSRCSGRPVSYVSSRSGDGTLPFNDPMLVDQWNYINTGDGSISATARVGADVNVADAWKLEGGNPSVIVAVVDEAVKFTHPDLERSMWVNTKELAGKAGADDDGNGYTDDIYGYNFVKEGALSWTDEGNTGHGTHVAGTIAATNGNGVGVCGIAGGNGTDEGVRIMSCQIYDGKKGGDALSSARAFVYAADHGASIIQCSFGAPSGTYTSDMQFETMNPVQSKALKYFVTKKNCPALSDGGLAIFASGNDAAGMSGYPAAYYECISVTSIGPDFLPASYTNYGPGCNIAAPGGDGTIATSDRRSMILSTLPSEVTSDGSDYGYLEGTSMACPHVSGVAALGLSYAIKLGKTFTREEFTAMLYTSVNDLEYYMDGSKAGMTLENYRKKMGTGLTDAWQLLMQVEGTPYLTAPIGVEARIDLDPYFGGSAKNLTYTEISVSEEGKNALGLVKDPEIRYGQLVLHCTKYGTAQITIKAIAGGDKESGFTYMGGKKIEKTVSVISRGVASENGGWL